MDARHDAARGGLAAARLAHDAERLAPRHVGRDVRDRPPRGARGRITASAGPLSTMRPAYVTRIQRPGTT